MLNHIILYIAIMQRPKH